MSTPWIVAFVALASCLFLLALIFLGTLRRIVGVLEQAEARLVNAPLSPGPGGLEPGTQLPPFQVRRLEGGWLGDDDVRGAPAAFVFLSSSCPACTGLVRDLRRGARLPLTVYVIVSGEEEAQSLGLSALPDVLIQPENELSIAFRTSTTPHAFAVGIDGTIIATSTPNSLDQLQELIRPPLEEGGEVALPQELNALRR